VVVNSSGSSRLPRRLVMSDGDGEESGHSGGGGGYDVDGDGDGRMLGNAHMDVVWGRCAGSGMVC